ncbi:T9SS type A sorting domain-containing protein [Flavobacteriales bacterium]|nr:T9SS type A sorting domain-containing protein [Flavobacteriales bacterium]
MLNQVVDPSCGNTNDGSVSLQISGGTPPYSIDWGGSNPNSLAIGNYVFVVNDDNNCADSNSVTLTSVSSIQVVSEITQISCNSFCDGSIDLTITGGVSPYTVDWFGVNPAFLCEGSVSYEIVDAIGCYFVENFQINSPDSVELNISQLGMQLEGIASGGVGPYSYEWFNDFGPLVNSQTVNITSNGSYYCIAIDVNHCQSDTVEYYYLETSIENLGVANLNIYPNPTDNILNIEFDSVNENDISLFFINVLGQKICIEMIEKFKGNYNYKFDLQSFPHGVYILELRSGSEVYNKKIIRK